MTRTLIFTCLLLITGFAKAQSPIGDSSFFTPSTVYETAGMKTVESNARLKVYSKADDKPDDIVRAVDIRWVFSSKQDAAKYLEANLEKESEGGYAMKKLISLPNAAKVYVFREEAMSSGMYEMSGAEHVHWYYIFAIDKVVAKVFTAGNKTSMPTSYKLALEAAKHISQQLGLPIKEKEITKFDLSVSSGFKEKIEKGNLSFYPMPGFEPAAIPGELKRYFDQEFVLPGEKYSLRYFIIKNEEEIKGSLADSVNYKKYIDGKKGASQSVSINIMMPDPAAFKMPNSNENTDRESCRKINNSDLIIEYAFRVGDNSVLAKGYKFCYMYATFKQNAPDVYVVFLSDDTKKIGLFRQMHKSSIKYRD
jgi:hypothetical protein